MSRIRATESLLDALLHNLLTQIVREQRQHINQLMVALEMAERRERDAAVEITKLKRQLSELKSKGSRT